MINYKCMYGRVVSIKSRNFHFSIDSPRDDTLSSLPPPLPPDLLPDYKNCPPDKHQLDHVSLLFYFKLIYCIHL